jgi:hypothetical protein
VESIGERAFASCSSLISIKNGSGVKNIELEAFKLCSSLKSITIPNSVKSIGQGAFKECKALTSVTIGNSVESIGIDAFERCSKLKKVISKVTTPSVIAIDYPAFTDEIYSTATLYVPKGTVGKYKATGIWSYFKSIKEEDASTHIDDVTDLINAIGSVENTAACKAKIDAARSAYDALTKDEQALVKNYSVLVEAENAYKQYETTAIADVEAKAENKVVKYIVNGKIVIVRNGKKYNLNGQVE